MQAVARFALGCPSIRQRPKHDARRCARRIDLHLRAPSPSECFGGIGKCCKIVRRHHFAGGLIEEQCREGGNAGKPAAFEHVELVSNCYDIARIEAAFMPTIEGVALRTDTRQKVLRPAGGLRAGRRFFGLGLVEDRPVVGPEGPGRSGRLVPGDLLQMAEMGQFQASLVGGAGTGHVDRHRPIDAAALDGVAERAGAADLFGHGEDLQAKPVSFVAHDPRIVLDRVEIDHIGVCRDPALPGAEPLQLRRRQGFDGAERRETWRASFSETFRAATRRPQRG